MNIWEVVKIRPKIKIVFEKLGFRLFKETLGRGPVDNFVCFRNEFWKWILRQNGTGVFI